MVNASRKAGLGRTLNRAQKIANQRRNPRKSTSKHTVDDTPTGHPYDNAKVNLKSVTDQTNLDEFLEEAELAGKQFVTERRNIAIVGDENHDNIDLYTKHEKLAPKPKFTQEFIADENILSVPRRPHWDSTTTPEQLDEQERRTFLAWRRKLAQLQENDDVTLTPFEKNLEIWRQLWRVIERSDIVVQILDSRNPTLYLCDDLIKYVNEAFDGKKTNLILLNKADFLTLEQRKMWAQYFKSRQIPIIFFSALYENENIKQSEENQRKQEAADTESDSDSTESLKDSGVTERLQDKLTITSDEQQPPTIDEDRIYNKFELIEAFRELLRKIGRDKGATLDKSALEEGALALTDAHYDVTHNRPPTVGLVGYPNVGKSSTINALLAAKRVAVSATPGKTKHFQTFLIDWDLMLCDCPGLVFPNFVSSQAEMVVNGVLPIDQMKDCISPTRLIAERIPRAFLEEIYGIAFDQDPGRRISAEDLLNAFGYMRGYMTARGLPDVSRAARVVCKDYINGKLLYCEPPPGANRELYHSHSKLAETMRRIEELRKDPKYALKMTERQRKLMSQAKGGRISSKEFDALYFHGQTNGVHIKGLPGIGNMTQPIGTVCADGTITLVGRREKKHKKREKLRRVFRHLDD